MHHADARSQRLKGRIEADLLAVKKDIPLVAAGLPNDVHAKEDLHERALAGAVLTAQAQHLALIQGEVDVGQDLVAEEVLFDVAHLQQGSVRFFHIFTGPLP